jgi:hypothetical protein
MPASPEITSFVREGGKMAWASPTSPMGHRENMCWNWNHITFEQT